MRGFLHEDTGGATTEGWSFVGQAGRTSINDVKRGLAMLPQEKVLGLVLNRDPHAVMTDYYRYKNK